MPLQLLKDLPLSSLLYDSLCYERDVLVEVDRMLWLLLLYLFFLLPLFSSLIEWLHNLIVIFLSRWLDRLCNWTFFCGHARLNLLCLMLSGLTLGLLAFFVPFLVLFGLF